VEQNFSVDAAECCSIGNTLIEARTKIDASPTLPIAMKQAGYSRPQRAAVKAAAMPAKKPAYPSTIALME
jgi:hypothetical protein